MVFWSKYQILNVANGLMNFLIIFSLWSRWLSRTSYEPKIVLVPVVQPLFQRLIPQPGPLCQHQLPQAPRGHPQLWEEVWLCTASHPSLYGRQWCLHRSPHGLGTCSHLKCSRCSINDVWTILYIQQIWSVIIKHTHLFLKKLHKRLSWSSDVLWDGL